MTSDLDIYRTASVLIRKLGDEADFVAAQRADSFLEAGDVAGQMVWNCLEGDQGHPGADKREVTGCGQSLKLTALRAFPYQLPRRANGGAFSPVIT